MRKPRDLHLVAWEVARRVDWSQPRTASEVVGLLDDLNPGEVRQALALMRKRRWLSTMRRQGALCSDPSTWSLTDEGRAWAHLPR
jgi:hypothetical protein